jgi:GT2 family glycosyltransferase
MIPLHDGTMPSEQRRKMILDEAGAAITTELLRRELGLDLPPANLPPLTVAICTKDHPELVARAIRSLFDAAAGAPDGSSLEILVVDNASSDERTREVADSFHGVRYVCEPKPGLDFARNRAIEESCTELLAFLDDDAVADRRWLKGLQKASAQNPDAGAFTGPVLPYELETEAQVLFEARGGFGPKLESRRFAADCRDVRNYPCNAGLLGTGCNMVFRRRALEAVGGFDEALDTGAPLPGGGDLDILYRIIRAGFVLVQEPELLVWHQHRSEHAKLRRQMYTWGLGMMAYAVKNYRMDGANRPRLRCMILGWFRAMMRFTIASVRARNGWKADLAFAELWGGTVGVFGEYDRSKARVERIRKQAT